MPASDRSTLTRFAWLSIAAAIVTISIKTVAYVVTGSMGLLSDAVEGFANLAGAVMALAMLTVAARPPDEEHAYGHYKAEYFSSIVEGTLVLIAAISIFAGGMDRLLHPKPIEQLGLGLAISLAATAINAGVALILLRAGRAHRSISLEADSRHLFTDVWTSIGVLIGVGLVSFTGWLPLDPLVAMAVAINIAFTGFHLVRDSIAGLMDTALPEEDQQTVKTVLARFAESGAEFHAVRTRRSGHRRFVSMHVLVPGNWTVHRGHQLLEQIEAALRHELQDTSIFTHLESIEDPASYEDQHLERTQKS